MHVLKTHLPYKGARVKFGRRYARIYKAGRTPKDTPQEEEEYTKDWLAFDIETPVFVHQEFKANSNYKSFPSPGIACVATLSSKGERRIFHPAQNGRITLYPTKGQGEKLSQRECEEVVCHLKEASANGFTIVTWNGTGFDFPILSLEASTMEAPIKQLARQHLDLMFQVLCMKGFPLSLEAAALGMSLQAKTHMKSEDVPKVWASGNRQAVLDYVCDDVKVTIQLAEKIHKRKEIIWKSKTGKTASLKIQDLMNVTECLNIPLPDVSWMNTTQTPYERSSYVGWLEQDSHSQ